MAKFLVIHPNLDIYGGGERVCHHILKALVAHGQQVELLSFNFDEKSYGEFMGEKLPSEVNVHTLGKREIIEANPPLSMYKRRRNIVKLLNKYKETAEYDFTFSTQTLSAFETTLFSKAKKNIAYVHFPEIPYVYEHSKRNKRMYHWLYKSLLEHHIGELDLVFVNSNYTKAMTEKYWSKYGVKDPIVAYPPVEEQFWSNRPLSERINRVVYVGRFIPQKRHEILKQLAEAFPNLQFTSAGLLRDSEQAWFEGFKKDLPANYKLKPNLSETELVKLIQDSTIYCHLMEGEHFGIAPMEALAAGCITLVHNSGGAGDFVPEDYRWSDVEDLKEKIAKVSDITAFAGEWSRKRMILQGKINVLKSHSFEDQIWVNVEKVMEHT
jgi:glycosyltransferase involved in cell wall biosynthesis